MDEPVRVGHGRVRGDDHQAGRRMIRYHLREGLHNVEAALALEVRANEQEREVLARRTNGLRRRGEARGLHLYEVDERSIRVLTFAWAEQEWAQIADRRFPRGLEPLATVG